MGLINACSVIYQYVAQSTNLNYTFADKHKQFLIRLQSESNGLKMRYFLTLISFALSVPLELSSEKQKCQRFEFLYDGKG